MLEGRRRNIAASVGEDGIVLWMTSLRRWQKDQAALEELGITDQTGAF